MTEREQVERLARDVMGWTLFDDDWWDVPSGEGGSCGIQLPQDWNPLRSASDDYMVLQRVRESGDIGDEIQMADALKLMWRLRPWCTETSYTVGDYSRAALRVLDSQEKTP